MVDILRERWKLTAFVTDGSYHVFDIETTQTALTDKPLIVQKYHYGGMAFRGQTRWLTDNDDDAKKNTDATKEAASKLLREPNSFLNDLGSDRIKGNHEHARWVSFTGQIDGQPVRSPSSATATIFVRHSPLAFIRRSRTLCSRPASMMSS